MSVVSLCNIAAWVLCGVVALLLARDFLRTERKERRDSHDKKT